ncbi:MAG TPA: TonB-dependent receptor plug domain-containing protein, partial [Agriterribacter sp.]|nr:TonB-dependent receptor plug domain-containing protein [Agriterribacter sp.]
TTDNKVIVIYKDDKAEKITMAEAQKRGIAPVAKTGIEIRSGKPGVPDSVLYLLDGIEISAADLKSINPGDIERINVIKDKSATDKYGARAKNGVVEITLKKGVVVGVAPPGNVFKVDKPAFSDSVLYFLDGVKISAADMKKLVPDQIESMTVLKDKSAIDKYGNQGKNGVIEIVTKNANISASGKEDDKRD